MRLSSLFTRSPSPHTPVRGLLPRRVAGRTAGGGYRHTASAIPLPTLAERTPAGDLPAELDARVRAVGEW